MAARRAGERAATLCRLLPNLGGPSGKVRRLYVNTVRAIALYGAPVWAEALAKDRQSQAVMARAFRPIAIRAARGYRTVSHTAATLLAGLPPMELAAQEYSRMYADLRTLRGRGVKATRAIRARLKTQHRRQTLQEWRRRLAAPNVPGRRVVDAILPVLDRWIGRAWGGLSFRSTQMMTGHGCFGKYLRRIGKEPDASCHHCGDSMDTAEHTLSVCSAWATERAALISEVGRNLSLPSVIEAMLEREESWRAFSLFSEIVMRNKEEAERERQGIVPGRAPRRGGRRRVAVGGPGRARARGVSPPRPARRHPAGPPPTPPTPSDRVLRPRAAVTVAVGS